MPSPADSAPSESLPVGSPADPTDGVDAPGGASGTDAIGPQEGFVRGSDETPPAAQTGELSEQAIASSQPFLGRWNELVSTTNWEKGRIIADWRAELVESGAAVTEYSDEAWARLVGGVTSQHVGRLRRVHERFGQVAGDYPGLYWSHFRAALDWDDAEMWLEGAITNGWSVSQLRAARWEAVGGEDPASAEASQVIEARLDEDDYQALVEGPADPAPTDEGEPSGDASSEAAPSNAAPWEDDEAASAERTTASSDDEPAGEATPAEPAVRPFAEVRDLPDDVAEAFEQFKLVILAHKMTGWQEIRRDELVGALDALKALAVAPSED